MKTSNFSIVVESINDAKTLTILLRSVYESVFANDNDIPYVRKNSKPISENHMYFVYDNEKKRWYLNNEPMLHTYIVNIDDILNSICAYKIQMFIDELYYVS